ncbi:glycoside hydrolase family 32 protein [Capnocytophaga catalasegens]|uniref:beta-fructofuranosidase n=1 Tax=Capnocytophaga catalasegens TaxID=1004260 RepID=A0AAV5AVI9_9FLAO|nr:glycoside hydrolase family 32 protein [Capnocytophaga catalasegens]GIZ15628.1 glycosyl hydrolase [Capnocytophaga catalasegens]GJM49523.1 glycosyl hydrolase [Capnocytophaga catalasegens]GJM51768.1 glycosyl hydrolase [Capnocytophaga catalasegens]
MKKYIHLDIICNLLGVTSCSLDDNFTSNDPNAAPEASTCYDIYDAEADYHTFFRPKKAWVGDPMPFYDNGKFYIYYLHDTRPAGETFHPWYLATTTDLFTYEDKGKVIPCGADNSQEDALGTGSVIKHNETYYAFYTAHNGNLNPKEKIHLATSTDLISWQKKNDFSLQASDNYDANEFRDPYVFKDGNTFNMLVTTRGYIPEVNDWQAVIAHYTSSDLIHWQLQSPFYYNSERVLECPDVFTMGQYQYLVYSNWDWANKNRKILYRYRKIGNSDWIIPSNDALDGDLFYGGKTISNGENRYLTGWIPTRNAYNDGSDLSWGGSLAVHQLSQNDDGTLRVGVANILASKLSNDKPVGTFSLSGLEVKVFERLEKTPQKITTRITADTATQFGIKVGACGNLRESYDLLFDLKGKTLSFNRNTREQSLVSIASVHLPILTDKVFDVTLIVEGSVATIYVNNQTALSVRCYRMNQNTWGIFTNDGAVTFSDVKISK